MMTARRSGIIHRQFVVPAIIAGICAFVVLFQLGLTFVWIPLRERYEKLSSTEEKLDQVRMAVLRGERAQDYCDRAANESLSADPAIVAHQYQQWLLKRTENLGEISVIPMPTVMEGSLGWRVPFQVEGVCPLDGLADLVDELNRIPLLHRITYLNIQRESRGKSQKSVVQFSLALDALALKNATTIDVFPKANERSGIVDLKKFMAVREPFTQGYLGPPPPSKVVVEPNLKQELVNVMEKPKVDPLKTFKLVGSVELNGKSQAWLVDSLTRQELFVSTNQPISFATFRGIVGKIANDFIEVRVVGRTVRWSMGEDLRTALEHAP